MSATTQTQTNGANGVHVGADSAEKLLAELPGTNTLPLWAQVGGLL